MSTAPATHPGPAVRIERLGFRYGERVALHEVDLSIERGEVFALLGPNGGGKTTLFRILSTLVPPAEGRVTMLGETLPEGAEALRHRIGVVFQSPGLDGKLTVAENLHHHGRLYGLDRSIIRERTDHWLARFGLASRARERVDRLSGGLARRTELCRAMLHRPELLILDEPSTGLDPGARRELGEALRELATRDGVTVILTTHFMEEADRADRVAVLDAGRIVATGRPDELKASIGHEVLVIECDAPESLRPRLARHVGAAVQLVGGDLRVEASQAHHLVGSIMEKFGSEIRSLSVGRPTLEDVFVNVTGRHFWSSVEAA